MKLSIEDNSIICEQAGQTLWTLDIDKLKVVGEFTTAAGPLNDDWFMVFADRPDKWRKVPIEAINEQFKSQLSQGLKQEITPSLAASAMWATRVIYPKELEGQELFQVTKLGTKPNAFWRRILGNTNAEVNIELTDKVKTLF